MKQEVYNKKNVKVTKRKEERKNLKILRKENCKIRNERRKKKEEKGSYKIKDGNKIGG